jgi:ATP-dependent DNA ligase
VTSFASHPRSPSRSCGCYTLLLERRRHLESVLDGAPAELLPVRRLADHGLKAWQVVLGHGWEGLVAKDPASPYVGGRSLKWRKVKQPKYREGERGWEPRPAVRVI